jgi:hypothetical protein
MSFQPSRMFVGWPGAYPSEGHFSFSTLGLAPALTKDIRLGRKALLVTNALAFYY